MGQLLKTRSQAFDTMRVLAVFGIIVLHVRFEPSAALDFGSILRLTMRWCVPFFYMLTGFFLTNAFGFPYVDTDRIRRITIIAIVANLLFLPLAFGMKGLAIIDARILVVGTWFHLWFLNSMVAGLVLFLAFPRLVRKTLLMSCIAVILILLFYAFDVLSSIDAAKFGEGVTVLRSSQVVSFIWIGFILGQNRYRLYGIFSALAMISAGFALIFIEAILSTRLGYSVMERQFPIGVIPIAIGLIIWGACANASAVPDFLPRYGRNHVLTIYIIHPLFLKIGDVLLAGLPLGLGLRHFLTIIFGFSAALAVAIALERFWPQAAEVLRGQLPELRGR